MTWHTHDTLDWVLIVLMLLAFLGAALGVSIKRVVSLTAVGLFLLTVVLLVV